MLAYLLTLHTCIHCDCKVPNCESSTYVHIFNGNGTILSNIACTLLCTLNARTQPQTFRFTIKAIHSCYGELRSSRVSLYTAKQVHQWESRSQTPQRLLLSFCCASWFPLWAVVHSLRNLDCRLAVRHVSPVHFTRFRLFSFEWMTNTYAWTTAKPIMFTAFFTSYRLHWSQYLKGSNVAGRFIYELVYVRTTTYQFICENKK